MMIHDKCFLTVLVLTLIVLSLRFNGILSPGLEHYSVFFNIGIGIRFHAKAIRVYSARHFQDCVRLCMQFQRCISISIHHFSNGSIECHLLPVDQNTHPHAFESNYQWQYMNTGPVKSRLKYQLHSDELCPCGRWVTNTKFAAGHICMPFASCEELLHAKGVQKIYCHIKPRFLNTSVLVECEDRKNTIWTVFKHDSNKPTLVKGYEECGSYKHRLNYEVNLASVTAFVDRSAYCKQWTKLTCHNTLLFRYNCGWLENRDGKTMKYFGGGPSNGTGCSCGIRGTCVSEHECNCDINRKVLLSDQGYVVEKRDLPITSIVLGDIGHDTEYIYYTLGFLKCRN